MVDYFLSVIQLFALYLIYEEKSYKTIKFVTPVVLIIYSAALATLTIAASENIIVNKGLTLDENLALAISSYLQSLGILTIIIIKTWKQPFS